MPTQFYARYIPPVNKKEPTATASDLTLARESKKRKRNEHKHIRNDLTNLKDLNLKDSPNTSARSPIAAGGGSGNQKVLFDGVENFKATTDQKLKTSDATILGEKKSKAALGIGRSRTTPQSEVKEEEKKTSAKREGKDVVSEQDATTARPEGPDDSEDITERSTSKHKNILSKFERSTQIAAELSTIAKNAEDSGQDLKEVQLKEAVETHGLVPLPQPPETPNAVEGPGFSALPAWLAHPSFVSSTTTLPFKELPLSSSTLSLLAAKGYESAFAIQSAVLPMLLLGPKRYNGDLCIAAATGSGKTLGYVLPMVENLRDKPVTRLRSLIVVPTRELVAQVRATLDSCSAGSSLKIGTAVGSKSLKDEQALLMTTKQRYDPEEYREQVRRQMDQEADYMDWEESEDEADDIGYLSGFVTDHVSAVDILVCTPGRLVDHMKSTKGFTLDHVQWLVVDEADRLLDESFQQWIDIVVPALERKPRPAPIFEKLEELLHIHETREIQKIILSATMTKDISKLIALRLRRPKLVVLENSQEVQGLNDAQEHTPAGQAAHLDLPASLKEVTISIKTVEEKPLYLLKLLSDGYDLPPNIMPKKNSLARDVQKTHIENSDSSEGESHSSTSSSESDSGSDALLSKESRVEPQSTSSSAGSNPTHGVLVFTNNNENALRLARLLSLLRPTWAKHTSSLTKSTATSAGRKALAAFRNRKLSVLIASDRASRGLDIENLAHVINYDMPTSLTSYVHRVGRTARAGKAGTATTLVAHHEGRWFTKEIVKSELIRRANKVTRKEWQPDMIGEHDREQYEEALSRLGLEARGEAS